MQTNMMPPPLPGHPGAAPAPGGYPVPGAPGQPNPYPGPPVHAMPAPAPAPAPMPAPAPGPYPAFGPGAPVQAPAPMGYAPPPAGYGPPPAPAPAYGAPQPGYGQAPAAAPSAGYGSPGDIGAAIAAATGGDRTPRLKTGQYVVEVVDTSVHIHPVERYATFIANLIVVESNNPALQVGSEVSYVEGITWGAGRVQDFLIGGAGYVNKATFDQTMVNAGRDPKRELELLGSAASNPVSQPGNHYMANPLKGRRIRVSVVEQDRIAGTRSRKAGQMQHIINHTWSPG